MSPCASLSMNPMVSTNRTRVPSASRPMREAVSRDPKRRGSARSSPAVRVSRACKLDLPALVGCGAPAQRRRAQRDDNAQLGQGVTRNRLGKGARKGRIEGRGAGKRRQAAGGRAGDS
eukprot:scaffold4631_cov74-Isochrysis_galbana.AAC.1